MGNIIRTSIIIYDSFKNVLIIQGSKDKKTWSLVGKELKGKETGEKCISKAVDKDLSCVIFELNPFKEYVVNEENGDSLMAYTGIIRERPCLHKSINEYRWISEKELDSIEFAQGDKEVLQDFFKSLV